MELDYDKVWGLIRGKEYSDKKISKIIGMSDFGFRAMMGKKSMRVDKLVKIVEHFNVRIESLFEEGSIVYDDRVSESRPIYEKRMDNIDNRLGLLEKKVKLLATQQK